MNTLEIAKMIADQIDDSTEEQIEAMVFICSKTHNINLRELTRQVQNTYYLMNRGKITVNNIQHESDPR